MVSEWRENDVDGVLKTSQSIINSRKCDADGSAKGSIASRTTPLPYLLIE
jgi:hypothetical protein